MRLGRELRMSIALDSGDPKMLQIQVQDELLWKAYPIEPQVPESLDSLCCSLLNRPNCEVDNYGQVNDGEDRQTTSSSSSTAVALPTGAAALGSEDIDVEM